MDRIVDVQRDSSQFSKIWNDGGKGLLHAHSLQGLMRDVNEDASTDPIVRQLMEEARHRVCGSAARSAAAHLCSGFLQSSAFHNACQKRCLSGVQRPLATLPPLPDNATWTERFRQIAVSQNTVHNSAISHTWPKLNSSACARDCTTLADIASRARDEMRPLGDSAAHDRFDFYATENKPFLVELGSPRHGLAPCTPAPPLGYYNFKRKYQILKKFYGAQHAYRVGGCGLLWLIDSESFAFRPFSFADDVFGRYAAQPTIFLGGPTSPTPAECHMRSLFANWGMDPERRAGARFVRALDLEPFHDDVWIWEGAIADDLLTSMRGRGSRSLAAVVLNSSSSYGTHHEQVAYYNWVLVQQQMREGKYAHVQRRDVEKLAASRWPSLQLEKHLASLRDGVIRDAGGTHTMIGPSVGRLHAAMALGMAALNASTAQRLHLRREFISLLHENGWVFVRRHDAPAMDCGGGLDAGLEGRAVHQQLRSQPEASDSTGTPCQSVARDARGSLLEERGRSRTAARGEGQGVGHIFGDFACIPVIAIDSEVSFSLFPRHDVGRVRRPWIRGDSVDVSLLMLWRDNFLCGTRLGERQHTGVRARARRARGGGSQSSGFPKDSGERRGPSHGSPQVTIVPPPPRSAVDT